MADIIRILSPEESAFRLLYGDEGYEYLEKVSRTMGYTYWEALRYGGAIFESGVQFPAGNDNPPKLQKPRYRS